MMSIPHASVFIREEREARGWSDVELAVKMGEDTQTNLLCLHMYEHVGPTDANLQLGYIVGRQIAKAFGVSAEYIWTLERIWQLQQPTKYELAERDLSLSAGLARHIAGFLGPEFDSLPKDKMQLREELRAGGGGQTDHTQADLLEIAEASIAYAARRGSAA